MQLPSVKDLDLTGKKVILRMDLDISDERQTPGEILADLRISSALPTLTHILSQDINELVILGHKGRPKGEVVEEFSLAKVKEALLAKCQEIAPDKKVEVKENLRFDKREEENDKSFAQELAGEYNVYINEAFAVSHRAHTSVDALPRLIKERGGQVAAGLHFAEEVEVLTKLKDSAESPFVLLLSGVKEDKLEYLAPFKAIADKVLVAGRLPEYMGELEKDPHTLAVKQDEKVVVANLNQDKEDITLNSVEIFENHIKSAKTIYVSGPMGKYEDEGQQLGTKRILEAVAASDAYKVAGGGDTQAALQKFGVYDKFDWVSVGGGAALELLSKGTLPGIEALQ